MRYVCVHGHFYQPPRENPWLDVVQAEPSAAPWHDWNRRISRECYAPNSAARILGEDARIERIVDNYERMSFDFGPTLLAWLEAEEPEVYEAVLRADAASARRFSGHGSAMAQPFHHVIQPLAGPRDKATQVRWGVADFEARFGRPPEGMWLPEAAVDLETLELLAAEGIAFTVLAPHQAIRVRRIGTGDWHRPEDRPGGLDTTVPYRVELPSGASLAAFFYDGPLSRAIAFERVLEDGTALQRRLVASASADGGLGHVAVDGETFGHHHRFGEMALAWALERIEAEPGAALTNYGEHLEREPPAWEAEIAEDTSWSCSHGVERWRADCGCATGERPGWTQEWRRPLRQALEWLRGRLDEVFEEAGGTVLRSPWEARDDYVEVLLDRSDVRIEAFATRHLAGERTDDGGAAEAGGPERAVALPAALRLLEMQRHAMSMFSSCGWFFDDLAGPGPMQVLRSAGRAIELAAPLVNEPLEERFLERLQPAVSNDPAEGDGPQIYRSAVEAARVDLAEAGLNLAVQRLVERGRDRRSSALQPHAPSPRGRRATAGLADTGTRELRRYRLVEDDLRCGEGSAGGKGSPEGEGGPLELAGEATVVSSLTAEALRLRLSVTLPRSGEVRASAESVGDEDASASGPTRRLEEVGLGGLLPGVAAVVAELTASRALAEVEPALRAVVARFDMQVPPSGAGWGLGGPGGELVAVHLLETDLAAALAATPPDLDAALALLRDGPAAALAPCAPSLGVLVEAAAARWLEAALEVAAGDAPGPSAEALGSLTATARLLHEARRSGIEVDPWRLQNRVWKLAAEIGPVESVDRGADRVAQPPSPTAVLGELAELLHLRLPAERSE